MKLSVSLPDDAVSSLDDYVARHPGATRSSALQHSIALLREQLLLEQYEAAMDQWDDSDDARARECSAGDAA